jgi:uncharacterized protein
VSSEGKGPFKGKAKRFATSLVLSVDKTRTGNCLNCGACCRFLVDCPFLKPVEGDKEAYRCMIYRIRPLQCRKYPRTKEEQIHQPCGYEFEGTPE